MGLKAEREGKEEEERRETVERKRTLLSRELVSSVGSLVDCWSSATSGRIVEEEEERKGVSSSR